MRHASNAPVAMITGTSSGIGGMAVRRFAQAGWRVVATTRRSENNFTNLNGVQLIEMEQSDPASIRRAVTEASSHWGRLDLLVNNAGYCLMGPVESVGMDQIRAQFEVNYFGLLEVTRCALPHLKEAKGGVINISSISADNGYPFNAIYSSSKAAVMALTEGLNIELEAVGVFAKAVLPGFIATDIFKKLDGPGTLPDPYWPMWRRFQQMRTSLMGFAPEEVANEIFEAATDGRRDKVRYYPTPDAAAVPSGKRLLGQDGYWRSFRRAILEGPSWLQRKLAPKGTREVKVVMPRGMALE